MGNKLWVGDLAAAAAAAAAVIVCGLAARPWASAVTARLPCLRTWLALRLASMPALCILGRQACGTTPKVVSCCPCSA